MTFLERLHDALQAIDQYPRHRLTNEHAHAIECALELAIAEYGPARERTAWMARAEEHEHYLRGLADAAR